ncbi:MAG: winged helix-turn-helix domain-containing protein [Candidatus Omnitrophota bacterium]|nr:winged helix-turn-helix domain-containing protein [Candidatus Omnitrophota bacterium]
MLEKLITSKTRVKILELYITHIDDRYYLRELERLLDESLSPLRRQLLKLVALGILTTEEEGKLKYYRLNKDFAGIEELRKLVSGITEKPAPRQTESYVESKSVQIKSETKSQEVIEKPVEIIKPQGPSPKAVKARGLEPWVALSVSLFIFIAAIFIVYTNTQNIEKVAALISEKTEKVSETVIEEVAKATATRPDEMISKRWKLTPGYIPVLSGGETDDDEKSKEL